MRRAVRLSQHTTRKPIIGRATRRQLGGPEFNCEEAKGRGTWKHASTRRSLQDTEQPEDHPPDLQRGDAPHAEASRCMLYPLNQILIQDADRSCQGWIDCDLWEQLKARCLGHASSLELVMQTLSQWYSPCRAQNITTLESRQRWACCGSTRTGYPRCCQNLAGSSQPAQAILLKPTRTLASGGALCSRHGGC